MSALVFTSVPAYREASVADGYVYECSCGELYNCVNAALGCRKCRNYCVFGYCTHVIDIRSNTVVAGEVPDVEEYEEAKLRAEAKWAEEKAQMDFNTQMWLKEGELYEAEMARLAEETAALAERERMDTLWAIQDAMMGF